MEIKFADPLDEILAKSGPSALFTMTHEQELQFDLFRTRDWRRRFEAISSGNTGKHNTYHHCVCVDQQTQWPMYVLITTNDCDLVQSDAHTSTQRCETFVEAQALIYQLKEDLFGQTSNRE